MKNTVLYEGLTGVESEVLVLLKKGMNTSEISKRLSMSYRTVAGINQSIKQKLQLKSFDQTVKAETIDNDN